MVSRTQKTEARRRRKMATNGKAAKKERARAGSTPKFPIHLEGKPAKAAAPKKTATAAKK